MPVYVIGRMTPRQFGEAVEGFARTYVRDWDEWLAAEPAAKTALFGRILGHWQATHGQGLRRRPRSDEAHGPPFIEDLLVAAAAQVEALGELTLSGIRRKTPEQAAALTGLWQTFRRLTTNDHASCVGISKAVLLVTYGRIGPALDSKVRGALKVSPPVEPRQWLRVMDHVGEDIAMYERTNGPLRNAVPSRFAHLADGRLYDMALGPR